MIEEFKKTVSYEEKAAATTDVRPASAPPTPAEPQSKGAGH
jgi:hypothetical protein